MKIRKLKKLIKRRIRESKRQYTNMKDWEKSYSNLIWATMWKDVNWTTFRKTKSWSKSTPDDKI